MYPCPDLALSVTATHEESPDSGRWNDERELAADRPRGQPLEMRGRRAGHDLLELLGQLAGEHQRNVAEHFADRLQRRDDSMRRFVQNDRGLELAQRAETIQTPTRLERKKSVED